MNNYKEILLTILNSIKKVESHIKEANQIDLNALGDLVDTNELIKITEEALMQQPLYNSTIIKERYSKYVMETRYFNLGTLGVYIEGNNVYAFYELLLSLIITNNIGHFNLNLKNYGVINLLLNIVNTTLETFNIKDEYKIVNTNNFINEYNNYILIGGNKFLNSFNIYNDKKIIKYCYNEFDVFIDDIKLIDAIDKNAKIYSTLELEIEYEKVYNVDAAINLINKNKNNYTSIILSNNYETTLKFLNNVQSRFVFSNVLPSANVRVGINQTDLLIEKTIAYQENA